MQYDSYKDSGEQWLGQIPSHWEMLPGKVLFTENKEKNTLSDNRVLSLSYGKIIEKRNLDEGLVPDNYSSYQKIKKGYIIVRCTDLQNDKVSLRTAISNYDGIITSAYLGLIVKNRFVPYFAHYLLRAFDECKELYRYGNGLRQSLSWNDFKYLSLPIPPLDEQERMVVYLDKETAAIDAAIAQQQRMIDLLNERKQIIIQQAVTKGLDPNAKMKDSGIDWIGQIPEGWEVKPFKSFFTYGRGLNITKSDLTEEGIPVVSYGQIHAKYNKMYCVTQELYRYVPEKYLQYQNCLVHKGDFIFADTSEDFEGCGNCVYIDKEQTLFAGYHTIIARPKDRDCDYTYFSFLIMSRAWRTGVRRLVNGVKVFTISRSIISKNKLLVPSVDEQKQISEFLIDETNKIDKEIKSKEQYISLLRERKQIIINEVVTGKIKV